MTWFMLRYKYEYDDENRRVFPDSSDLFISPKWMHHSLIVIASHPSPSFYLFVTAALIHCMEYLFLQSPILIHHLVVETHIFECAYCVMSCTKWLNVIIHQMPRFCFLTIHNDGLWKCIARSPNAPSITHTHIDSDIIAIQKTNATRNDCNYDARAHFFPLVTIHWCLIVCACAEGDRP